MKASDGVEGAPEVGDVPDELEAATGGTVVVVVEHRVVVVDAGSLVVVVAPVVLVVDVDVVVVEPGSVVSVVLVARMDAGSVVDVVVLVLVLVVVLEEVVVVGVVVEVVELVDVVVVVLAAQGSVVVVVDGSVTPVVVLDVVVGLVVGVVVTSAWMAPGDLGTGSTVAVATAANGNALDRATIPTADAISQPARRRILLSSPPSRGARFADSGMFAPTRCPRYREARGARVTATIRMDEHFATHRSEVDREATAFSQTGGEDVTTLCAHAKFIQTSRRIDTAASWLEYVDSVAEHEAKARKITATEWDVVCPGCPGHGTRVGAVRDSPALTCQEQAQLLADFHRQIYSEAGDRILR